jgi:ABC-2 type transport system ATP-binding protein
VLCTHFLGEAGRLAHRMAVLHRGRLHAVGRPDEIAADLWSGLEVDLDIGAPADDAVLGALRAHQGVLDAVAAPAGALLRVAEREVLPRIVSLLVDRGVPVYGSTPRPPTLEDVYFAVEARIASGELTGSAT